MTKDAEWTSPLEQLAQLVEEHKDSALNEIPVPKKLMEHISKAIHETIGHLHIAQGQLMQSEKMATLGQLVAGIAHEINTPVASINSNIDLFARSLDKINAILGSENTPKELRETRQIAQEVQLYQYVEKPWDNDSLLLLVRNGLHQGRLLKQLAAKTQNLERVQTEILKAFI